MMRSPVGAAAAAAAVAAAAAGVGSIALASSSPPMFPPQGMPQPGGGIGGAGGAFPITSIAVCSMIIQ